MKRGDVVLVGWPYSDRTGSKFLADSAMRQINDCLKQVVELP